MIGFFVIEHWNQNRSIWKYSIQPEDIERARQKNETIIDVVARRYFSPSYGTWIPIIHQ
jgi:hypothetical protein